MQTSKLVTAGTVAALAATSALLGPFAGTASGDNYFTPAVESCWPQMTTVQDSITQTGVRFTVPAGCQAGVTYRVSANLVHTPCEPDGTQCTNPDDTSGWHDSLGWQTEIDAATAPATPGGTVNLSFSQICAGSHNGLLLQIDVDEIDSAGDVNVTHRYVETAGCVEAGPPAAVAPADSSLAPAGGPDVLPAVAPLPDNAGPDTLGVAAVPETVSTPVAATTTPDVAPAAVEAPPHLDSVQVEASTGTYIDQPARVSNATGAQAGTLPHTGASHTRGIIGAGAAALVAGAGFLGLSRRRRTV